MKRMMAIGLAIAMLLCGLDGFAYAKEPASAAAYEDRCGLAPITVLEFPEAVDATGVQMQDFLPEEVGDVDVSEWEQYGSRLFYNQLDQTGQKFWDDLSLLGISYLTQEKQIVEEKFGGDAPFYMSDFVSYRGLSRSAAEEIVRMFLYSNPQYYFYQPGYWFGEGSQTSGKVSFMCFPEFADGQKRLEATKEFFEKAKECIAVVSQERTEWSKEKAAHDWICMQVRYDFNEENVLYNQTAYSALVDGTTVCAGYAQAMELVMNATGVDCVAVTSAMHQWNLIRIKDTWYHTDLTWDDNDNGSSYFYTYFNRSTQKLLELEKDTGTEGENHVVIELWEPYLPALTKDSGAEQNRVGTVYEPTEQAALPVISMENGLVSISQASGADIYYTLDGREPAVAADKSMKYIGAFTVESGTQVQAIAAQDGYWDSDTASAVYQPGGRYYTVAFESNGGSLVEPQKIEEKKSVGRPADPVLEGSRFIGWYLDRDCTEAYDFATLVTEDVTLYAKWEKEPDQDPDKDPDQEPDKDPDKDPEQPSEPLPAPKEAYTVLFESNQGSAISPQTIVSGETVSVPQAPVREGYRFIGWYTTPDFSRAYNFANQVSGNFTLYAKWESIGSTIRLDANGGYIGKKTVKFQEKRVGYDGFYGKLPWAKRKGYAFLGWYTKKSGGTQITPNDTVKILEDTVYYAHWAKIKPKKASIASLKNEASGKLAVRIKANKTASGYQIRYARKASMQSAKTVKTDLPAKRIGGLKKGKTYYVQARMYQKESVSGKISYGAWSKTSKIKIKK